MQQRTETRILSVNKIRILFRNGGNIQNLKEISKQVYFSSLGHIDYNEIKKEYSLSELELNYVIIIIRNWDRR